MRAAGASIDNPMHDGGLGVPRDSKGGRPRAVAAVRQRLQRRRLTKSQISRIDPPPHAATKASHWPPRGVHQSYGKTILFQNETNPVKNTYELTIPETLVPIGNPIGHLHRPAPSVFLKNAPRARYMQNHTGPRWGVTLVHGGVTFGEAPARPPGTIWPHCHLQT